MKLGIIILSFLLFFVPENILAQRTQVYAEANAAFKHGLEFYDLGLFSLAQIEFNKVLDKKDLAHEPEYRIIKTKSELLYAQSAVRLDKSDGQKLMMDFVRSHQPDPQANQALLELADYFYNGKKYSDAIEYYALIDPRGLQAEQKSEVAFKHGYALFVKKQFKESREKLSQVVDAQSEYYYPANYYYGMAAFYEENYDLAIQSWKRVQPSNQYRNLIPYYVAQIYFLQGEYDALIEYAAPYANSNRAKNRTDLNQLVGQAYFEKGDYINALPYLEYYESKSRKLREEDFYQLALVQYHNGKYEEAIPNFRQLDRSQSALGQSAMHYLADCYLKGGDRASARNAFQKVSRLDFDRKMMEDALFNYGKLSMELHFDRDAIQAFQRFEPSSRYYQEAQELLSETLVNTKDYKRAIRIIEKMPNQTPRIKEAYQKVTYYQALKDYTSRQPDDAILHFKKSLNVPIDLRIKALATFWTGEIRHLKKEYGLSKAEFNKFFTLAKGIDDLPPSSSLATAYYTQGYNYLKTNDYSNALQHFASCIDAIQTNTNVNHQILHEQVLPDTYLRAGDCNFKRNRYAPALAYYDKAINLRAPGFEYALFQKAVIQGLRGRDSDKLLALEELVDNYPNSDYADDALLEMGETYQNNGQFENALLPLDKLVSQYKGKSNLINVAHLKLGLISYNLGDINQALRYYKNIFKNNPTSKEANDALAAIEEIYVEDMGNPDGYVAFVESIPGYSVSGNERDSLNYQVAERYYENAEYEKAINSFTDYIRKYPNGFHVLPAYYNRGESYSITKNYDPALSDYEIVINKGDSRYYLASMQKAALISYNHTQDFEKSYSYYSKLESLSNDPEVKFEAQLGSMRSAYRSGKKEAAVTYASKVMANPRATKEEMAVAQFFRGKMAFENKAYDEALQLFKQVIDQSDNENTAEARYLRAYIYYLKRDIPNAEQYCRSAYSDSGSYPFWVAKSLILLSDILVEKKDFFNAKAALEAVIDNFSEDEELVGIARAKFQQIENEENKQNRINNEKETGTLPLDNNSNQN